MGLEGSSKTDLRHEDERYIHHADEMSRSPSQLVESKIGRQIACDLVCKGVLSILAIIDKHTLSFRLLEAYLELEPFLFVAWKSFTLLKCAYRFRR